MLQRQHETLSPKPVVFFVWKLLKMGLFYWSIFKEKSYWRKRLYIYFAMKQEQLWISKNHIQFLVHPLPHSNSIKIPHFRVLNIIYIYIYAYAYVIYALVIMSFETIFTNGNKKAAICFHLFHLLSRVSVSLRHFSFKGLTSDCGRFENFTKKTREWILSNVKGHLFKKTLPLNASFSAAKLSRQLCQNLCQFSGA